MAAAIGQTISVIDKSGKVVSTSKHLFSVFKEARSAYRERKAVIRNAEDARKAERDTRRALEAYTIEDGRSTTSKRHLGRAKSVVRHYDDDRQSRHHSHHSSRSQKRRSFEFELQSQYSDDYHPNTQLARRHTEHNLAMAEPVRPPYADARAHTLPKVDMDLAYGEFHPSALERIDPEPSDMSGLVGKVKGLLVEADCAHHSVTAIISHLQSNPDAMAAVALTLAELSKLVSDLGPTALTALRASAPAVFALLASPQFMIAAGVGIGVTVVMFGGYKIIKQISSKPEDEKEGPIVVDELMQINPAMSRVEGWRRGVAESEAESVGTSVDGEFITPTAAAMSRVMLHEREHDRLSEIRGSEIRGSEIRGSSRILPAPTRVSSYVGGSVYEGSQYSRRSHASRSSRHSKSSRSSSDSKDRKSKDEKRDKEKEKKKKKKPSPLRKLFS